MKNPAQFFLERDFLCRSRSRLVLVDDLPSSVRLATGCTVSFLFLSPNRNLLLEFTALAAILRMTFADGGNVA